MIERSKRLEVRNPVLGLPAAKAIQAGDPELRTLLADLLMQIAKDAAERAQKSWRTHKAPMALYWKAVSVYAKHIARAVRPCCKTECDLSLTMGFCAHD